MVRFFHCLFSEPSRRVNAMVLAFALLLGYLLGSICVDFMNPDLFLLMRIGAKAGVSIVCLLPVLLLPFLFSAIAVFIGLKWLVIPVAFLKAFLFSYLCCHILTLFPDSGSLFAVLFLFSDILSLPVMCWFWIRCICGRDVGARAVMVVILAISGIGFLNYQVISPFLASLLS